MLAVGPPTSEMATWPRRDWATSVRASARMDSWLRELMRRPWCRASEQKEQPPPQPRWLVMLVRSISSAGMGSR